MNKSWVIASICVLTAVFVALFFFKSRPETPSAVQPVVYTLNNQAYRLLLADTPAAHQRGLMHVRSADELSGADGMLFVFPNQELRVFWNQNTFVDLDLYWIADDQVIGQSELPSIEKSGAVVTVTSPAPADKVVEIIRK